MAVISKVTVTRVVEFTREDADEWPDLPFSVALMLHPTAADVTYVQQGDTWVFSLLVVRGNRFRTMKSGEEAKHGPGTIAYPRRTHPAVFSEIIHRGIKEEASA
jgi:hypothetical protein